LPYNNEQGDIMGSIIGTDVVRYDIYGKEVQTANKMESCGEPGRVMISETTKKLLDITTSSYEYEPRREPVVTMSYAAGIQAYYVSQKA